MKFLVLLLFFVNEIFAITKVHEIEFESGIEIYGKIGRVSMKLEENFTLHTYKMRVTSVSIGILKSLTSNRKEIYISTGVIKDGIYIPKKFVKKAIDDGMKDVVTYKYNGETKYVLKSRHREKEVLKTYFSHELFKFIEKTQIKVKDKVSKIPYCKNDFLSLYLNYTHNNLDMGSVKFLDQKGKDKVTLIDLKKFRLEKNHGEKELLIELINDEESVFFKKAITHVAFFGDAYIEKISEKDYTLK